MIIKLTLIGLVLVLIGVIAMSYYVNKEGFDDISNGSYDELILNSKIILLDTFHDGTFELKFYNHLKSINYKGYLLLDDIKLNNEMVEFWNQIELEKQDLTHIGHVSGTGVVYFN